jgi:hypothetical protein
MFYRCIRFNTKPINIQVRDPIQKEQKGLECAVVWRTGLSGVPTDCVRCTRTVQGQTSHSRENVGALRHNSPDCPVCQRGNGYLRNGRLLQRYSVAAEVRAVSQRGTGLSVMAPDCPVQQEDKAPTVARSPNPNSWVTWRRTEQRIVPVRWCTGLSGAPIASSLPNDYFGG